MDGWRQNRQLTVEEHLMCFPLKHAISLPVFSTTWSKVCWQHEMWYMRPLRTGKHCQQGSSQSYALTSMAESQALMCNSYFIKDCKELTLSAVIIRVTFDPQPSGPNLVLLDLLKCSCGTQFLISKRGWEHTIPYTFLLCYPCVIYLELKPE